MIERIIPTNIQYLVSYVNVASRRVGWVEWSLVLISSLSMTTEDKATRFKEKGSNF